MRIIIKGRIRNIGKLVEYLETYCKATHCLIEVEESQHYRDYKLGDTSINSTVTVSTNARYIDYSLLCSKEYRSLFLEIYQGDYKLWKTSGSVSLKRCSVIAAEPVISVATTIEEPETSLNDYDDLEKYELEQMNVNWR